MRKVILCFKFIVFVVIFKKIADATQELEFIPEKIIILNINEKYVENATVSIRRYKRRGDYLVSATGITKHVWDNNVTIDIIFYEYLHNEYKRSFVEFHFKLCDLINKDELIGAKLRLYGLTCPFKIGFNGVSNATLNVPKFPYVFPFTKCKAQVTLKQEPSHELIGKGDLFVSVKKNDGKL